jgi:hypothetical protein
MSDSLMRFIAALLAAIAVDAWAFELVCRRAEHVLCEDLLHLSKEVKRIGGVTMRKWCGFSGQGACAVINLKAKTCTIYHHHQYTTMPKQTWFHEMNHCLGWTHKQETLSSYASPWVPLLKRGDR